ncbi:MAG: hypothetical protein ACRDGA_13335, partial [Bacteroidota bacterium]
MHHYPLIPIDISQGLHTQAGWLVPEGFAAEMTDCYPQPGVGIRAFLKFDTFPNTGIGSDEIALGAYVENRGFRSGIAADAPVRYLMTLDSSNVPR